MICHSILSPFELYHLWEWKSSPLETSTSLEFVFRRDFLWNSIRRHRRSTIPAISINFHALCKAVNYSVRRCRACARVTRVRNRTGLLNPAKCYHSNGHYDKFNTGITFRCNNEANFIYSICASSLFYIS